MTGLTVASALDWDGEGLDDVLVGTPEESPATLGGVVRLFTGGAAGTPLAAAASHQWTGGQAGAAFGSALAAGDVDGDGHADVFVGAPSWDGASADEGRVVLLQWQVDAQGLPVTGWSALGGQAGAAFGSAVAALDLTGDGFVDLAVGAPYFDNGTVDEGVVLVFPSDGVGLPAAPSQLRESDQGGSQFGIRLADAGAIERCDDVDSDCDGDLLDDEPDADGDGVADCLDDDDDGDGTEDASDCAPLDVLAHPGAQEACDGSDRDCDGLRGEDDPECLPGDDDAIAEPPPGCGLACDAATGRAGGSWALLLAGAGLLRRWRLRRRRGPGLGPWALPAWVGAACLAAVTPARAAEKPVVLVAKAESSAGALRRAGFGKEPVELRDPPRDLVSHGLWVLGATLEGVCPSPTMSRAEMLTGLELARQRVDKLEIQGALEILTQVRSRLTCLQEPPPGQALWEIHFLEAVARSYAEGPNAALPGLERALAMRPETPFDTQYPPELAVLYGTVQQKSRAAGAAMVAASPGPGGTGGFDLGPVNGRLAFSLRGEFGILGEDPIGRIVAGVRVDLVPGKG